MQKIIYDVHSKCHENLKSTLDACIVQFIR
jgi:hypothetical protein